MKKRQYKALLKQMQTLQDFADDYHTCVTSQMQDLSDKLKALREQLGNAPYLPVPQGPPYLPTPQGPPYYPVWSKSVGTSSATPEPFQELHTYIINDDGTRQECAE